ncbi:hypothetical protein [Congregibacter sp.]|uniref:hypothetical protein n=1 Tax=Congregibacter sp. TaxID=2744308 RepID=UPI003F6CD63D
MRLSDINEYVQTGAALVAIVGIFLLGYEVQQANRIAALSANQLRISDVQDINRELAISEDLAEIIVKLESDGTDSLSPAELVRARAWHMLILRGMEGQYYQYQEGFLDRKVIDRTLEDISQGIYARWEQLGLLDAIESQEWHLEIRHYLQAPVSS